MAIEEAVKALRVAATMLEFEAQLYRECQEPKKAEPLESQAKVSRKAADDLEALKLK